MHRAIIKPFLPIMDSHRVESGRVQEAGNISGSGRVTIFVGRVGSGLEIWTRVQLCCTVFTRLLCKPDVHYVCYVVMAPREIADDVFQATVESYCTVRLRGVRGFCSAATTRT